MSRPQKINSNLRKVVCKPNSRSHPPLTRRKLTTKKEALFPLNRNTNTNNTHINSSMISQVIPPSSSISIKANSNSKNNPSSLNSSIKPHLQKQSTKTIIRNNFSLSKLKDTLSLLNYKGKQNNNNQKGMTNQCGIMKSNQNNPSTCINNAKNNKSHSHKRKGNINTSLSTGIVINNTQDKQNQFNIQFGTNKTHQKYSYQLNINHQTKNITNKQKTIKDNRRRSSHNNSNPIMHYVKGTINYKENKRVKSKQLLFSNVNINDSKPKNALNQLDIIITAKNRMPSKAKKDTEANSILNSLSRNQRSSLESIENLNTKIQYKTKNSKEMELIKNKQQQLQKLPKHLYKFESNNTRNDKIFHTINMTHCLDFKRDCKSKKGWNNYNTNVSENGAKRKSSIIKKIFNFGMRIERKLNGNVIQGHNRVMFDLIKSNERYQINKSQLKKNNK